MDKKIERQNINKQFGLIGKNISYSFSQKYFSNKFKTSGNLSIDLRSKFL